MIDLEKFREKTIKNEIKKDDFFLIEISMEIVKFVYFFFLVSIPIN